MIKLLVIIGVAIFCIIHFIHSFYPTYQYNISNQWYLGKQAVDVISVCGNENVGKREMVVAVIDTGVAYNHKSLGD